MFDGLVDKVQDAAARSGCKAAIGLDAVICLSVGLAFLPFAAWLVLVSVTTPINAPLIIGGVYSGIALIMIGALNADGDTVSSEPSRHAHQCERTDVNMGPKIVEAFTNGLHAGWRLRS